MYGRTNSSMDQVLMTGTAERRRRYRAIDKPLRGSAAKMNRAVICERITLNQPVQTRASNAVITITISLPIRLCPCETDIGAVILIATRKKTYVIDGDLAMHATNSLDHLKEHICHCKSHTNHSFREMKDSFAIFNKSKAIFLRYKKRFFFFISSLYIEKFCVNKNSLIVRKHLLLLRILYQS